MDITSRDTLPRPQPTARPGCGTLLVLAVLLGGLPVLAHADEKIDSIENSGTSTLLSLEEIEAAEPLDETVTPEELELMRQRYRELNPGLLEIEPGDHTENLQQGVPAPVNDPDANSPYWSTGKLAFKKADGKTHRCTAQFVGDLKIILTAAHCVYDIKAGAWNTNFTFKRAYTSGKSAQTVGWRCMSIFDAYHAPAKNYAYDYAFILTDKNDEKPPLTLQIGIPATKPLTAVGYPRNYGNGKVLQSVDGEWASVLGGIVTISGNPMRKGNSGGAWFSNFKIDGGSGDNLVVSLNSHHLVGNDVDENGPLFTADTARLLKYVLEEKCL
ncbi:S1 family peptidase [Rhizobium sp. CG5]|uniref:trypsin-like serine peptidase n=1 Tax=Rhizobium sp. CG5 TaxID=2726076 RepID=UPI002033DD53|nr:trypsin-like serine protease [Rhizobium sp. CG5]MCM2473178.1 S1 family peptidase [Rhizobium sp. CG5]